MVCFATQTLSIEGFAFVLATAPMVFTSLIKHIPFLCRYKGFHDEIYLDNTMVLTPSKHTSKRAQIFLCSLLVHLRLHIIFPMLNLTSFGTFFLGLCWEIVDMSVSLPTDKFLQIQHLAHSLLQRQPVTVHHIMSFLCKTTFCASGLVQLCQFCHVIQSDMFNVYHSLAH